VLPVSGSAVDRFPTTVLTALFSAIEVALRVIFVGGSLTLVTLMMKAFSKVKPP
jgi:hypothetical protein